MSFKQLPNDLKNIISDFCYKTSWLETKKSLQICEEVKMLDISPLFLRRQMWSWAYLQFLPNPLSVFEPINRYTGRWSDMIDWHCVNELLFRLDYRRRVVRLAGTRHEWFTKFKSNWMNIGMFDAFYRIIINSGLPCFKPIYERQRANCLTLNSPFSSARWLLEDFHTWET